MKIYLIYIMGLSSDSFKKDWMMIKDKTLIQFNK